ncbi:MAG TPA: pyrimidine reductase family protein [Frankiaceae bacterium]|nr:pyrimidine reductase family protein [Frankiaceae bacterium]
MRSLLPPGVGEPDLESVYAFPDIPAGEVFLRGNFVSSVDGAIEVDGRSGPLGGTGDKRIFGLLRGLADVVLVGAGTARAERYGPAQLPVDRQRSRIAAGRRAVPPIAVVTAHGIDAGLRLLEFRAGAPKPLVLTTEAVVAVAPEPVRAAAEFVACGTETVDLPAAVAALQARNLTRIVCEGGPRLITDLIREGLLDELCLTLAPQLAGPGRAGMSSGEPWPQPRGLDLAGVLEQDGDLFLRYRRRP